MNAQVLYKQAKQRAWELQREAARQRLLRSSSVSFDKKEAERLWNKNFLLYWLGTCFTSLGSAITYIALPFLVLHLGHSPAALGAVFVLESLPRFFGPLLGTLADRLHLKLPLLFSGLLRAALFAALGLLASSHHLSLIMIYLAAPLSGAIANFFYPASNVLLPQLAPKAQLARANSFIQAAMMGLPLVGYGLAGALVAMLGAGLTLLAAAPCFLVLTLVTLGIHFPPRADSSAGAGAFLEGILSAVRQRLGNALLAFMLLVTFLLNLTLNMLNVIMPVTMLGLGKGAAGYGLFETLVSLGTLGGIGLVAATSSRLKPQRLLGVGYVFMAGGFVSLAVGGFGWALGGGAVTGVGLGMVEVSAMTFLQLLIPDGMRGKIMGLSLSAGALGLMLGATVAGQLVNTVSNTVVFSVSAAVIVLLSVAWILLLRRKGGLKPGRAAPSHNISG
jgi:MFS family permease